MPGLNLFDCHWFFVDFKLFSVPLRSFCGILLPLVESLRSDDGGGLGVLGGTFGGGLGGLLDFIFFDFYRCFVDFKMFSVHL